MTTPHATLAPPRLEALVENVPGNVYRRIRRPDGSYHFAFLSSGLFRHFGIDNEALLAEPALRFQWIHPDDRERFQSDLALSAATLSVLDHRIRVVGIDGRVHWARGIARPERWPDGSVVWDGIVIDVTREVEAEAALRITREESERANQRATAIVASVATRLRQPIEELQSLLEGQDPASSLASAIRRSLADCLAMLRVVREGEGASPGPAAGAAQAEVQERRVGAAALTPRQREVMRLVSEGRTNKEIAQRLGISPGTVRLHVAAVLKAMRATTRRQLQPQ